ncbi:hypothetical protein [Microcoleus sp.]|uniref:hypothetical protein n=1 Tax=Microcoleus sp. TaxID=44472 RepID=UPI003525FA1C
MTWLHKSIALATPSTASHPRQTAHLLTNTRLAASVVTLTRRSLRLPISNGDLSGVQLAKL